MLCALIMAGGKGTRFWPLSTEEKPKQFLNLLGERTMLQMTVDRIKAIVPLERIFICTGSKYLSIVKEQLPDLCHRNIILEPEGRNTAPCIALSAFIIDKYYKDSKIIVLPSDHLINREEEFLKIIKDGEEFLNDYPEAIITLGITPSRAETGYGYIKFSNEELSINGNRIIKVDSFVEKPNKEKAEEYLVKGNYLWNGGMFLWTTENILSLTEKYLLNTYRALNFIKNISDESMQDKININYSDTDNISIDFGIMENADNIYVIPSDIEWDDIGTWNAIERYVPKDSKGNISIGDIFINNGSNNLAVSTNKNIIINDLDNIYVIESEGNIVIGKRDKINIMHILGKSN